MNNLFLIGLILILILVGFGYLIAENQQLHEENKMLSEQLRSANENNAAQMAEVERLKQELAAVYSQWQAAQGKLQACAAEYSRLLDENKQLRVLITPLNTTTDEANTTNPINLLPGAANLLALLLIGKMAYDTHQTNRRSKAQLERHIYQQIARAQRKRIEK